MRESMLEVKNLLKARIECIWITSYEENEVIKDLKEILRDMPSMKMQMWSATEGIKEVPVRLTPSEGSAPEADPRTREIPALFNFIKTQNDAEKGSNNLFVLRDLHDLVKDFRTKRCIRDIKEYVCSHYNPIVVVSPIVEIPDEISKLFRVVDYGIPDKSMIQEYINEASNRIRVAVNKGKTGFELLPAEDMAGMVDACVGLTAKEIRTLLFESSVKYKKLDASFIMNSKIQSVKKSGALDYKMPAVTLDDIGGNTDLKNWLQEVKASFSPEAKQFGLPTPKGYMAVGIPGCSKTLMAEAFAGMMGWPLLSLSMSKIMDRMVGSSEKKIVQAINVAKACAPCVLLLDEVEKMLGGISSSNNSDSGITARVFQELLKFMNDNESGVYVIMTSNDVSQLPPEFTRAGRLDAQWYFGLPNNDERSEIFSIHFARFGREVGDFILDVAVKESNNFTGAEIQEAVKVCMRKVFVRSQSDDNTEITADDVREAIGEIVPLYESSQEKIVALERYCQGRARMTESRHEEKRDFDPLAIGDGNMLEL